MWGWERQSNFLNIGTNDPKLPDVNNSCVYCTALPFQSSYLDFFERYKVSDLKTRHRVANVTFKLIGTKAL